VGAGAGWPRALAGLGSGPGSAPCGDQRALSSSRSLSRSTWLSPDCACASHAPAASRTSARLCAALLASAQGPSFTAGNSQFKAQCPFKHQNAVFAVRPGRAMLSCACCGCRGHTNACVAGMRACCSTPFSSARRCASAACSSSSSSSLSRLARRPATCAARTQSDVPEPCGRTEQSGGRSCAEAQLECEQSPTCWGLHIDDHNTGRRGAGPVRAGITIAHPAVQASQLHSIPAPLVCFHVMLVPPGNARLLRPDTWKQTCRFRRGKGAPRACRCARSSASSAAACAACSPAAPPPSAGGPAAPVSAAAATGSPGAPGSPSGGPAPSGRTAAASAACARASAAVRSARAAFSAATSAAARPRSCSSVRHSSARAQAPLILAS